MPFTNFPTGFASGLSVRGMPLLQMQPGQVFFVNNSSVLNPQQKGASNNNRGTFLDPFSTLAYALSRCVHNRGDIVFVGAGHKETISSATILTLATAGVAVIGLGAGATRPTFTFTTADTANIPVTGAGISIQNCLFVGNFLSIAACFTALSASVTASIATTVLTVTVVGSGTLVPGTSVMGTAITPGTIITEQLTGTTGGVGTYRLNQSMTFASGTVTTGPQEFSIDNCEFRDTTTILGFLTVVTGSASANALSGFTFTNNKIYSLSTVSVTCAIVMSSAADRITIRDNFGVSAITAVTQGPALLATGANSLTNVDLGRNRFIRPNTSTTIPVGVSTSATAWTGHAYDNYFWSLNSGTGIWINTGTKLGFTNNYSPITGAADKSALINPVAV